MLFRGQADENGILFVCFPITAIAAALSRSPMTVKRSLSELETAGLIMRVRQGVGEPNRIYVLISSADMLVFVVTNELFDSYLAEHFRKLAIDKDKAGEMILVVNKMDRASDGNTEIQQNVIREDLRKVLTPYTPEQLNLCFLDAESYLDTVRSASDWRGGLTKTALTAGTACRSSCWTAVKSLGWILPQVSKSSTLTQEQIARSALFITHF